MEPAAKQGLILGAIVGAFMSAFFLWYSDYNPISLILIPLGAVMGAAPQFLRPPDMKDDD